MNLRKIWTELVQKPAGRLLLFLVVAGIFLAFVLMRRPTSAKPDNRPVMSQPVTAATGYSFEQNIPELRPAVVSSPTPAPVMAVGKPSATPTPPPIPQAIFASKEVNISDAYLPYGRLVKCELVNTVDSSNIQTPIIGLVTEDVWHDSQLIIPAGTEVHGTAQRVATRERIGSDRQWTLVFRDGRELPVTGTALDYAPDASDPDSSWGETDGSAGLRGTMIASDKYAEAKSILAAMLSAGAAAFPQTTNLISPLTGGATQIQNGGLTDAFSAGISAGTQIYSQRLLEKLDKDPYYIRAVGGKTLFYLYITQTVDLNQATAGLSPDSSK